LNKMLRRHIFKAAELKLISPEKSIEALVGFLREIFSIPRTFPFNVFTAKRNMNDDDKCTGKISRPQSKRLGCVCFVLLQRSITIRQLDPVDRQNKFF
jgi:hypothetical protein